VVIRHVKYICEPRNINVEVTFPVNSRHVNLSIKVNDKPAYEKQYLFYSYPTKQNEYDWMIAVFCSNFVNLSHDELELHTDEDKYMLALNAHKFLNKVLYKSGNVVWSRC
jgi:hypothetical protein